MKKVIALLFIAGLISSAFQCNTPTPNDVEKTSACGRPEWLTTLIANAEQSGTKGEVFQYDYKGETVFSINTCVGCADAMTEVLNCAGETKCQFGGIAGFNTCPDFEDQATNKKLIWSN